MKASYPTNFAIKYRTPLWFPNILLSPSYTVAGGGFQLFHSSCCCSSSPSKNHPLKVDQLPNTWRHSANRFLARWYFFFFDRSCIDKELMVIEKCLCVCSSAQDCCHFWFGIPSDSITGRVCEQHIQMRNKQVSAEEVCFGLPTSSKREWRDENAE